MEKTCNLPAVSVYPASIYCIRVDDNYLGRGVDARIDMFDRQFLVEMLHCTAYCGDEELLRGLKARELWRYLKK
jgi:hypothetical protein